MHVWIVEIHYVFLATLNVFICITNIQIFSGDPNLMLIKHISHEVNYFLRVTAVKEICKLYVKKRDCMARKGRRESQGE